MWTFAFLFKDEVINNWRPGTDTSIKTHLGVSPGSLRLWVTGSKLAEVVFWKLSSKMRRRQLTKYSYLNFVTGALFSSWSTTIWSSSSFSTSSSPFSTASSSSSRRRRGRFVHHLDWIEIDIFLIKVLLTQKLTFSLSRCSSCSASTLTASSLIFPSTF